MKIAKNIEVKYKIVNVELYENKYQVKNLIFYSIYLYKLKYKNTSSRYFNINKTDGKYLFYVRKLFKKIFGL